MVTDQVRGENLDIPVLDVNAYLSEGTRCHAVRNRTLFYGDDSHGRGCSRRAAATVHAQIREKGIDLSGR
jgi:hypothetical protein